MKTRKVLIILLLVGVMAALALLLVGAALVGAAGESQELAKDLVVDWVESNVDGHPTIDDIVERIPNDCEKCHNDRRYHPENPQ
jgi:hypothetical protein